MASLNELEIVSVLNFEGYLGSKKLDVLIHESEASFRGQIYSVAQAIVQNPKLKAVFISGPTSSGKTTFAMRLQEYIRTSGRPTCQISLDDYYKEGKVLADASGRPDYESIRTIDCSLIVRDIQSLLKGQEINVPDFNFVTRARSWRQDKPSLYLPSDGVLVVEGLHGLSSEIFEQISPDQRLGIFIVPWGQVVSDKKLLDSQDIRILRRIVRDSLRRGAHALATLDYWPMIKDSEVLYFQDYLKRADYNINSWLNYESLVMAPLALMEIEKALLLWEENNLPASKFLQFTDQTECFSNIEEALLWANNLKRRLKVIPEINASHIPTYSILQEFI